MTSWIFHKPMCIQFKVPVLYSEIMSFFCVFQNVF